MIFFSDFQWHDLGIVAKILIFLGYHGKINCQDLDRKSEKSKTLRVFSVSSPAADYSPSPVEAVAAATSVHIFIH